MEQLWQLTNCKKAGEQNPFLLPASRTLGQKTNLVSSEVSSSSFCPQSHLCVKCQALSII